MTYGFDNEMRCDDCRHRFDESDASLASDAPDETALACPECGSDSLTVMSVIYKLKLTGGQSPRQYFAAPFHVWNEDHTRTLCGKLGKPEYNDTAKIERMASNDICQAQGCYNKFLELNERGEL